MLGVVECIRWRHRLPCNAMPDQAGPPSEFGGKVQKNRVQPRPHSPTASEQRMLLLTTGDDSGTKDPDGGLAFDGLIPYEEQLEKRKAEGVMEKGQIWEELSNG